jgi:16S rRNA (guanine527-N7)-methyltransferase
VAFASLVPEPPGRAVDLGSGGGIPGLVLAVHWPTAHWVLLDANERRIAFLRQAVAALGVGDRVDVVAGRAEVVARSPSYRATADLVVARSFAPPAVTAECAAPLLHVGGALVVAEPPGGAPDRWPAAGLALVGLMADGHVVDPSLQRLRQSSPCPDRYPRRPGIPAKRPLF